MTVYCKACGHQLKIRENLEDTICETCFEINNMKDMLQNYVPLSFVSIENTPHYDPKFQRTRENMTILRRKFDDNKLYINEVVNYIKDGME